MKKKCVILNYEIICQIGQGGNSVVYSARDNQTNNVVAIKVLRDHGKRERFEREIKFLREHDHPHITKFINDGEYDGKRFHVCELYPSNLNDIIKTELTWEKKFNLIIQLTETIMYLHEKNIHHRDLKPENIYIDEKQNLIIGDFGLINDEVDKLTKATDKMANAFYAAPEQLVKGNSNKLDAKVDIYALGKLINQLFTKKNISGTAFEKIENTYPYLYEVDSLVNKMIMYNSIDRPTAAMVYYELNKIKEELKCSQGDTADILQLSGGLIPSIEEVNEIWEDLYYAQMLFKTYKLDEFSVFDCNWHLKYAYNVNEFLSNLCFNEIAYKLVKDKFLYEGNVGIEHELLDVKVKEENIYIYEEFCALLNEHKLCKEYDFFVNRIKKYFNSCCDYHANEIISELKRQWKEEYKNIYDAPILWLIRAVKYIIIENTEIFDKELINLIELSQINQIDQGEYNPSRTDSITKSEKERKINILESLVLKNLIKTYIEVEDKKTKLVFLDHFQLNKFSNECFSSKKAEKSSSENMTEHSRLVYLDDIEHIFSRKMFYEGFVCLTVDDYDIRKIDELTN